MMRIKLLLLSIILSLNALFLFASHYPDWGESVNVGGYYTFPNAQVQEDSNTDRTYGIRISFSRAFLAGDKIDITLPNGWQEYPKSTKTNRMIKISGGATALQVENFLQNVKIYLSSDNVGNEVGIMLSETIDSDMERQIYYSTEIGRWYEYVEGKKEWWNAYNLAKESMFAGYNGYLVTFPYWNGDENADRLNNFLYSISSGKKGWLGGTCADIRGVYNELTGKLTGAPATGLNYWYWACGMEYEWTINPVNSPKGNPADIIFYNRKKAGDSDNPGTSEYCDYNVFGTGKPDNAGTGEQYLYMGYGNGKQWDDGSTSSSVNGYFVQYDSYAYFFTTFVGYESKKKASIGGVYNNGTETNPVRVVFGDTILYEIEAVNSPRYGSPNGFVVDTVPLGFSVVNGSITHNGDEDVDNNTGREYIRWDLSIPIGEKETVSFKVTPDPKVASKIMNYALVYFENPPATRSNPGYDPYEGRWTDTTWHESAVCKVTFDSIPGPGGSIGGNPYYSQIVDYSQHPVAGITISPDPGHEFVGWSYPAYTSLKGESKPAARGVLNYDTISVYGDIHLTPKWSFKFDDDTVCTCTPPMKLESGHDGIGYTWILPDGSEKTTADIQAQTSGKYYLHTDYGSIVTVDSIVVLFAFDDNIIIEDLSPAGNKIDRPQIYTVAVDSALKNVTYQWSFSGGDPATSTADTVTVLFETPGKKTINVTVTVTMPNLMTCMKTLSLTVTIYGDRRNFFVDQHVAGGDEDGTSWTNAYRRVEDALNKASSGDCIWVAEGEYTPPANSAYLLKHDSIEVYGGFGAWETYLNERNYAKNPTTLRGSGTSVIVNTNAGQAVRWDGFIIENGVAVTGGGIFNNNSSPTIANCIIRSNYAEEGGGVYTLSGSPFLYNVEMSGNTAKQGGGMYTISGNPHLLNVTISGNQAVDGGGIYNDNANPEIHNSIIWGNKADGNPIMINSASMPYFSYTLIERYGDVDRWDDSFGINGGHNIGGSPFFKRSGFDDDGNMRVGDYRLGISSPCINRGLNRFIYDVSIRWGTHLESLTDTTYLKGIPYDIKNNNRIEFDVIDMGAYEYARDEALPILLRQVYLPDVNGLILDLEPGEHYVVSQEDFVFTIAAKPGYDLDDLTVETGNELRDKEGLKMVWNGDSTVTVTLVKVTETILVTINGISPTLSNEVGNETIDNGQKVWAYGGNLYVRTDKSSDIQVYTMMGQLYLQRTVERGETAIPLGQGYYTVRINDQTYKVFVRK